MRQPGHIPPDCAWSVDLLVLQHLFQVFSVYHVPMKSPPAARLDMVEVFIQLVKGCGGSCTAAADNGGPGLINHVFLCLQNIRSGKR